MAATPQKSRSLRKTGEYDGATSSSPQTASWVYDNSNNVAGVTDAIGKLTTETSYNNGNAYTIQEKGFNVFGESLGETVTLPTAEGVLQPDPLPPAYHPRDRRHGCAAEDRCGR